MPSLGASMEAGTLVEWLKRPGDVLRRGDIIAVVDTEKGAIEIEVFEDGVLEETRVPPGATVPVGTVLAIIHGAGVGAPPPTPPAPLRFYGFAERSQGGRRQVFLTDGEEVYLAAEGDVVLHRYRVLRVGNQSIELEEVSGKQRWVVPLEQP